MINDIYTDALLAAAAYADWGLLGTAGEPAIKAELIKQGFTEAQYYTFFDASNTNRLFEVIPNGYTDDLNGFSATAFRERATGNVTVAFRGTNIFSVADWLTNINVIYGGRFDLDTDLLAFLGQQDDSISVLLQQAELLANGALSSNVNFTGHSLGGFLSTMAAYKYSDTMGQATTFNGLGASLSDFISNDIINGISLTGKLNNYYADFVGANVGFHPGVNTELFIENANILEDHYMVHLVESLSVYRVLALLDPILDSTSGLSDIKKILEFVSNNASQSLETMMDKLGDLLGGNFALQSNKDDAELFYQEAQTYLSDLGGSLAIFNTSDLAYHAKNNTEGGLAYRYALVNLNPFAITGDVDLYAQHNINGELNTENFSDQYLSDRAQLLSLVTTRNRVDNITNYQSGDFDTAYRAYYDAGTDSSVHDDTFFYSGTSAPDAGSISPSSVPDFVEKLFFGNDGDNVFEGGDKDDHLYGMAGSDQLTGGKGNEILSSGTGADTYHFTTGDGADTLIDQVYTDDKIIIDSIDLSLLNFTETAEGTGLYTDTDFNDDNNTASISLQV